MKRLIKKILKEEIRKLPTNESTLKKWERDLLEEINENGLFEIAKYYGGVKEIIKLTKDNPLVSKVIHDLTHGEWVLPRYGKNHPNGYRIPFTIESYEEMMAESVELTVDLDINLSNLSDIEKNRLKQFLVELAQDYEGHIEVNNDEISEYYNQGLYLKKIGGEVTSKVHFLNIFEPSDDYEDGFNLLKKTL